MQDQLQLLDADEMMTLLGVSRAGLYKMVADGRLPKSVRIGRKAKWFKASVEKVLLTMSANAEQNLAANRPAANRARYKKWA